jgi:hypothetical protein
MTLTIFFLFLVGLALSLRFNCLILYPAIISVVIGAAVCAATYGNGVGVTVLIVALGAAAIQMGYLFGLVMRAAIASFAIPERKGSSGYGRVVGVPRISPRHEEPETEPQSAINRSSASAVTVATAGRRLAS